MPKFTMSDGREFTDYRPSCDLNQNLQQRYNVPDSHAYRQYLQKNFEQVRQDLADCTAKPDCITCPVCKKAV